MTAENPPSVKVRIAAIAGTAGGLVAGVFTLCGAVFDWPLWALLTVELPFCVWLGWRIHRWAHQVADPASGPDLPGR